MRERGIIFNAEMVRAILDGRKTQTRRVMKVQPVLNGDRWEVYSASVEKGNKSIPVTPWGSIENNCPFGKAGDRLWVRETFKTGVCAESTIAYKATHKPSDLEEGWYEEIKWTPSIHMPRWASRITLEITDVRVERLQSISEADAKAEGFDNSQSDATNSIGWFEKPIRAFRRIWENIYGDDGWNNNHWVWVIEFKKVE
ncbi:MAG: ASCH domain-containing protein [Proteus mirabilis]|nr:ASCH domain-containing protein [Proteus mirabilis]